MGDPVQTEYFKVLRFPMGFLQAITSFWVLEPDWDHIMFILVPGTK